MAAYGPCASSKNVASTGPLPSSRVRNTTRRPDRIGGVWVATLTPATSSSERLRRRKQVARPGDAELAQHRGVELHDVAADVEAEDLQLGADAFGTGHLREPGGLGDRRGVAEVEGELDRVDRSDRQRGLGLHRRQHPRVVEVAASRVQVAFRVRRKTVSAPANPGD